MIASSASYAGDLKASLTHSDFLIWTADWRHAAANQRLLGHCKRLEHQGCVDRANAGHEDKWDNHMTKSWHCILSPDHVHCRWAPCSSTITGC